VTQKTKTLKEAGVEAPKKRLRIGFNMYTALANIEKPLADEEVFRLLSSKPGSEKF
jgi:hypothetical protein